MRDPAVLEAFDPRWAVRFFAANGMHGFVVLSAVVLVVTGGEALYADLGHFGRAPIRIAGFVRRDSGVCSSTTSARARCCSTLPQRRYNPFFELVPGWLRNPMVVLATAATVVASQALITACFSLTQQLVHLGLHPARANRAPVASHRGPDLRSAGQHLPDDRLHLAGPDLPRLERARRRLRSRRGGHHGVTTVLFYFVARWVLHWSRWSAGALAGGLPGHRGGADGRQPDEARARRLDPAGDRLALLPVHVDLAAGSRAADGQPRQRGGAADRVAGGRPRRQQAAPRAGYRGVHDPRVARVCRRCCCTTSSTTACCTVG